MNLEIHISKDTCFYYWLQVMSHWSSHSIEAEVGRHYPDIDLSKTQQLALGNIRQILQRVEEPRLLLAILYSGNFTESDAQEIAKQAEPLKSSFEQIWQASLPHLEKSAKYLRATDFTRFAEPMRKIADFLEADFNIQDKFTVYLLPNPAHRGAMGHVINKTRFMLVRPSGDMQASGIGDTISTIAHEYAHAIEHCSKTTRVLFKNSYEKHIGKNSILPPSGHVWRELYVESLIYCFASKTIGGYLSPEIYQKPSLRIDEVRATFQNLVKQKKHSAYHIMNWAALTILPDVEVYIERGQPIDEKIADKLSKVFLECV